MKTNTMESIDWQKATIVVANKPYESIFVDERVNYCDLPDGFHKYEIMEEHGTPVCIQNIVIANFYGTLISKFNMDDIPDDKLYSHCDGNIIGFDLKRHQLDITNHQTSLKEYIDRGCA